MQPFDLFALAVERRAVRERQAWSERFRRRSKAVDPTPEKPLAPAFTQARAASSSRSGR